MAGGPIPDIFQADLQEARKDEAKDAEARQREEDQRIHERLVSGEGVGHDDARKSDPRIDAHDAQEVAAVKREAEKQVEEIASKMPKADNVI